MEVYVRERERERNQKRQFSRMEVCVRGEGERRDLCHVAGYELQVTSYGLQELGLPMSQRIQKSHERPHLPNGSNRIPLLVTLV